MTLEEALELFKKASDVAGNYLEYVEIVSMHSINIVLSEIFNEHEAQLKAKDIAIELLANVCKLGLETQDKYRIIIKAKDEEIERLKVKLKRDLNEPLKSITINQMGGGKDEY